MFSLRIVDTDHYLATPLPQLDVCFSDFRQAELRRVPVVRIYGATPQGQKTCMHLHGVFPYMYVPCDDTFTTENHLRQFACSIDKALNVALGNASSPTQHVYKISLVSGIPFYGYHSDEAQFLKIYFINPLMVKKAADLLLGGAVMNKVFQPHETHIPYRLQMFIDYNLYGMNLINVAAVKFRQKRRDDNANPPHGSQHSDRGSTPGNHSLPSLGESFLSNSVCDQVWQEENIPSDLWLDGAVERQSTCELEVDVVAADILNRHEVGGANIGVNPGLVALWEDEKQRRVEKGADVSELKPQTSQDRGDVRWTEAEAMLQERLQQVLLDLAPYIEESESDVSDEVCPSASPDELSINLQATPSSALELHLSQSQDVNSSQDTLILEEDSAQMSPIVNLSSVQRVVSLSQSFREERTDAQSQPISSSQDRSLAHILASLADDSPAASQVASQIVSSEERDSILTSLPCSQGEDERSDEDEEEETMQMSQLVWEGHSDDGQGQEQGQGQLDQGSQDKEEHLSQMSFDLEGMDQSWNSSLWQDVTNQNLPQYDGVSDEKADNTAQCDKKPLDTRGSVVTSKLTTKSLCTKSNGEKVHHLGELHVLLKEVQRQRESRKSNFSATGNGDNGDLVLDLRSPTPRPVHPDNEELSDSDMDPDKTATSKVANFILNTSMEDFSRVSASEESDTDSLNASDDLFDAKNGKRTKSHGNIFSTLSSELAQTKLVPSDVNVKISSDIQLPFNRDHLPTEIKEKANVKAHVSSNGSDRVIESDSDERLSVESFPDFRRQTSCIVPRRPSSESSSTDNDLHVGPHAFTYDRTAAPRKEYPQFTQVLDRNKPFPEILKELEGSVGKASNDASVLPEEDSVSRAAVGSKLLPRPAAGGKSELPDIPVPESDISEYEELLPDQDSTSISENEAAMLDLTGCDDPMADIVQFPADFESPAIDSNPQTVVKRKRGRPPGAKNMKNRSPKGVPQVPPSSVDQNVINSLPNRKNKRQTKATWKMREDFVQDLSSWVSGAESSSDPQASPRGGESSDSSYVPYHSKPLSHGDKMKRSKLSLTKRKKRRSELIPGVFLTCKTINEDSSDISRLCEKDNAVPNGNSTFVSVSSDHSVRDRHNYKQKYNSQPADVIGNEERVWFSSTAQINYCDGQKSKDLQALECCVQVPKDEYFKYDFSKICNEKLCLKQVSDSDLLQKYPPALPASSVASAVPQTVEPLYCSANEVAKVKKAVINKPRIITETIREDAKPVVPDPPIESASMAKHPALLAVKAPERGSSRRSSADGQVSEKGHVCELDFSFLENPMDTGMDGLQGSEMQDSHLQLHTPPLVIDPDQNEADEVVMKSSVQGSCPEEQSPRQRADNTQFTPERETNNNNSAPDDITDRDAGSTPLGLALSSQSGEEDSRMSNTITYSDVERTSQDSQDRTAGCGSKKVLKHKLLSRCRGKKRSNSLTGYYSDVVDDWEDKAKKKKFKYEQSEHYKYRFKRRSADYAESAFSLIYQMETSTNTATREETMSEPLRKGSKKERLIPGVHYIIINRFKGHKSMCVLTPKLKVTSSIDVKDFMKNPMKYCWKKDEEPTTYERELSDDESSPDSDYSSSQRPKRGRKPGHGKAKRKQPRSMYERLSRCFVTRKHRRRKSNGTQNAKFMDTLSLLHQVTLAKLTDSPSTVAYNDATDDHKTSYNDVMFNLALFSPPSSENGGVSPPQPLSPSEEVDSVALSRARQTDSNASSARMGAPFTQGSVETLYDTPLSSVETNKCQSKSPENLLNAGENSYHDTEMTGRNVGSGSPNQPDGIAHRRDSNSSGSLYAVKEAVVRLTPPVGTGKLFTSSKYSKEILPPDLGPPLCRQVSPRSLHSGSSGSPPSLHSHYDRSPRLVDSDCSGSGAESMSDDQLKTNQNFMYLYSDADNVVTRMPCKVQKLGSSRGSSSNASPARSSSTRRSVDSDNSMESVLPHAVSRSYSGEYMGSQSGSVRSDSTSPRNKYEVQCEPISDSSDGEEEEDEGEDGTQKSDTRDNGKLASKKGQETLALSPATSSGSQPASETVSPPAGKSPVCHEIEAGISQQMSPVERVQEAVKSPPQSGDLSLSQTDMVMSQDIVVAHNDNVMSPTHPLITQPQNKRSPPTYPQLSPAHSSGGVCPQHAPAQNVHSSPLSPYAQHPYQQQSSVRPQASPMSPSYGRHAGQSPRPSGVSPHSPFHTSIQSPKHYPQIPSSATATSPQHYPQIPSSVATSLSQNTDRGSVIQPNISTDCPPASSSTSSSSSHIPISVATNMENLSSPMTSIHPSQHHPLDVSFTSQLHSNNSSSLQTSSLQPGVSAGLTQPSHSSKRPPSTQGGILMQPSPGYTNLTGSSSIQQLQQQQSPNQHSPINYNNVKQSPHQQHSPAMNYSVQQSPMHGGGIQQPSPVQGGGGGQMMQQSPLQQCSSVLQSSPGSHSNSATMQPSPVLCGGGSVQPSPSHSSNLQHSPLHTLQPSPQHSAATLQQQQQSPLQCASLQLSPLGSGIQQQGGAGGVSHIQQMSPGGPTFHATQSPAQNLPTHCSQNPQLSPVAAAGGGPIALMHQQNALTSTLPPQSPALVTSNMPLQSPLYTDKQRQKSKKLTSPGYSINSDILSPVSSNPNSGRGSSAYPSPSHCQDYSLKPQQQNVDSGLISSDERNSMLSDIRQFDMSRRSRGEQSSAAPPPPPPPLTESCYMPPHHMTSMFDLNRHSNNNMSMLASPSYSNYPHRSPHGSTPGGGGFAPMPGMYHSPPPPPLHQNQHNYMTQYPTNGGGSQSDSPHPHTVAPPHHYPPRSCAGYEPHSWNSHPGIYPTSAFRHTSCGREEPSGWYPHTGRDPLTVITPVLSPPTKSHLLSGLLGYGLSDVQHRDPYCSNHSDLPDRPRRLPELMEL